jgi:hypothetical protein
MARRFLRPRSATSLARLVLVRIQLALEIIEELIDGLPCDPLVGTQLHASLRFFLSQPKPSFSIELVEFGADASELRR